MSAIEQGLFYLAAVLALAGALGTVASRSAIRSAMSLLTCILGIAGLYLTLSAELLAAVQVIVYAGAIVVLFVFVIMILGPTGSGLSDNRTLRSRLVGTVVFALAAVGAVILMFRAEIGAPHAFEPPPIDMGSVSALGRLLFTDGVVAFELAGVLLLAAIVGVMGIARTRHAPLEPTAEPTKEVAP